MAISNPYQYQQYQQQQVFTAPPDKLLLMLFDGAIRFCNQAKKALVGQKLEESNYYIIKAEDIILELMTTLKMDFEFSQQLYSLYDYLYRRLVEANIEKDMVLLDEVVELLTELRQTWAEVAVKARETRKMVVGGGGIEG
ncbi:MAG: flagellar export chaperone FliS [Peptococcia bacterium]